MSGQPLAEIINTMNNIFKKTLTMSVLAACVMLAVGCGEKEKQPAPVTDKSSFNEQAAYSVGASVGTYLAKMQEAQKEFIGDLDQKLVIKGFVDAINGKTDLDNKQIESALKSLDEKLQESMTAKAKQEAEDNLKAGEKFLEENKAKEGVKVTESGLQYKVIAAGEGAHPTPDDNIKVTYKGTTIDGEVFDEQKEPVEFPLRNMIPGWVEALQLMSKGSEYELYLPASLAYGENGAGNSIKPNSVLVFNVKLVDFSPIKAEEEAAPAAEEAAQ